MVSFMPNKVPKYIEQLSFKLISKNHIFFQSWHDSIFIITSQALPKKMMNCRAVKSMKLFICEQLCLGPSLGIVLMLA